MKRIVHIVGTGTIGEPLIGLFTDFRERMGIEEVTFHKRTPLVSDRAKLRHLMARGARLAADDDSRGEFERLGHEVTTVGRFADATERLAQGGARYDALLVDVHLDEAHTGFDLFDHLRTEGQGRERLIVFTTGDSISTQTRDALERADRPVLRKPFSLDDLREMLERVAAG